MSEVFQDEKKLCVRIKITATLEIIVCMYFLSSVPLLYLERVEPGDDDSPDFLVEGRAQSQPELVRRPGKAGNRLLPQLQRLDLFQGPRDAPAIIGAMLRIPEGKLLLFRAHI